MEITGSPTRDVQLDMNESKVEGGLAMAVAVAPGIWDGEANIEWREPRILVWVERSGTTWM